MGHSDPSMGAHYRERVEDSRLRAVTDHVRAWLFADPDGGPETGVLEKEVGGESSDPCDPSDPAHESQGETDPGAGRSGSDRSHNGVAPSGPPTPGKPRIHGPGSHGSQGSHNSGPSSPPEARPGGARPRLRLFVG